MNDNNRNNRYNNDKSLGESFFADKVSDIPSLGCYDNYYSNYLSDIG